MRRHVLCLLVFLLAIALAAAAAPSAGADTIKAGGNVINETWTAAGSPYIVQGDLPVPVFSFRYEDQPLAERLAQGKRSLLFSGSTYYAAATMRVPDPETLTAAPLGAHWLADARLLARWSLALHAAGDEDKARYLAERAREFGTMGVTYFFRLCDDPTRAIKPYQCQAPMVALSFQDFKPK